MQKDNIWNVGSVKAFASGKTEKSSYSAAQTKTENVLKKKLRKMSLKGS